MVFVSIPLTICGQGHGPIPKLITGIFGAEAETSPVVQTNEIGGRAVFIPTLATGFLSKIIEEFTPAADVSFDPSPEVESELGLFSYIHKVRNGQDIYFFANSSDNVIETDVLLRGRLKLDEWDPHTGTVSNISQVSYLRDNGQIYT